jgi:quinolinate synthase
MHAVAPHKKLIEAPTAGAGADCESCAHCEWFSMTPPPALAAMTISLINLVKILPRLAS